MADGASKGDGKALKGDSKALKIDGEVLKGDRNAIKSNGEVFQSEHFENFGPTSKSVRYSGLLWKAADKSSSVRVVTSPLSILTIILCLLVYFQ